jgi:hypothetical protein
MTCNYEKFIDYLKVRNKINQELQNYYEQELFRKLRWRNHTYTQKSESILHLWTFKTPTNIYNTY